MNIELKDFLKKYSTAPDSFIDEYYELQISKNVQSIFKIDLDVMAKWLGARKDHLKDTLVLSYVKNINYTVSKEISNGKVGKPNEKIMITNDTFKRMCMLSKSKKAELVRTYFISLENLVDRYKDHIIDSMERKIEQLENNQKPKVNPQSGVIYVIRTDKDVKDMFKIGKSKVFKKRLMSHNSSHGDDLHVPFVFETKDHDTVEACLKSLLKNKQYRTGKEIYQVDIDIIKSLIAGCENLQLIVKNKSPPKLSEEAGYYVMLMPKKNK